MRAFLRLTLVLAIFFAALCPAWCLMSSISPNHGCCHGKAKPCGQMNAGPQTLPQASIAPAVPALVPSQAQVTVGPPRTEATAFTTINSASPPLHRSPAILRI